MKDWRSQSHVKWHCKYHIVIVPKYRRRKFYGSLRSEIGKILRQLCRQREIELVEGKAMSDHVHLLLSRSTEIQHRQHSRVSQREECDSDQS